MDEKTIARNLRKPEGADGIQIGEFMAKGNLSFYENILKVIYFNQSDSVLEIGMGSGTHIENLFPKKLKKYIGLDYSKTMVEVASKNNKHVKYASFITGDAHQIPVEQNTMDVIFTINTLYFYTEPLVVLEQIKNTLKKEGCFILGKRTEEDLNNLKAITQYGFKNYSELEVTEMLNRVGFEIIKHEVYKEPTAHANHKKINLHNEFYVCKLSVA